MPTRKKISFTIMTLLLLASLVLIPFCINKSVANPIWLPPELTVLSPIQDRIYNTNVPLTLNITLFPNIASWEKLTNLYYCLDENSEVELVLENSSKSNEVLVSDILYDLNDGKHNLFVHGVTDWGNTIDSNVTFTVNSSMLINDNTSPEATILFPKNETYISVGFKINLNFQTNKPFLWARFSLDNQANETILGNTTINKFAPSGSHNIKVYIIDAEGNIGASETIQFTTVFLTEGGIPSPILPVISVEQPQNATYNEMNVPLTFRINEPISVDGSVPNYPNISQITYCLDGQNNRTIDGNTVLKGLTNGEHNITVYASDIYGNTGNSQTIFFTVQNETFPTLTVLTVLGVSVAIIGVVSFYLKRVKSSKQSKITLN